MRSCGEGASPRAGERTVWGGAHGLGARAALAATLRQRRPPAPRAARAPPPRGRRLGDRAHDHHPAGAEVDHLSEVAGVQAADRKPGLGVADGVRGVADVARARRRAAELGRRLVHGPGRQVVDVRIEQRGIRLRGLVRRAPDDPVGPRDGARRGGVGVVLADVHAVGRAGVHEIRPIVEDEQRAVGVGRLAERAARGDQPVVGEGLVAQLDDVDATAQRGVQERGRSRVADQVQTGLTQALAACHEQLR